MNAKRQAKLEKGVKKGKKPKTTDSKEEEQPVTVTKDKPNNHWTKKYPPVPTDKQGYAVSYNIIEMDKIIEFFHKYGFAVVSNIVSDSDCDDLVSQIWDALEARGVGIKRNDWSTCVNDVWPHGATRGFLSDPEFYHLPAQERVRSNPDIYRLFCAIWKQTDLQVSMDRIGFMRPTKAVKGISRTSETFLHWDQNAITEPNVFKVQGVLSLVDCAVKNGTFQCVPGFPPDFGEWGRLNQTSIANKGDLVDVPQEDSGIQLSKQSIGVRKGSLIVWDSKLPHGNTPNFSAHPRIVMYITMQPSTEHNEYAMKLRQWAYANGKRVTRKDKDFQGNPFKTLPRDTIFHDCNPYPRFPRPNYKEPNPNYWDHLKYTTVHPVNPKNVLLHDLLIGNKYWGNLTPEETNELEKTLEVGIFQKYPNHKLTEHFIK